MKIVVTDYQMGNLGSVWNMLKKIGADAVVSSDAAVIASADKLVLPGVGAFDNGMTNLKNYGLLNVLYEEVIISQKPILGICLGMQLMSERSEEGSLPGLGWIQAEKKRFKFDQFQISLKVPHMGWNTLNLRKKSYLFDKTNGEPRFYFVHSYHVC